MAKKNFYAVKKGRQTGIFKTYYGGAFESIDKFPGAQFSGFQTIEQCLEFLGVSESPVYNAFGVSEKLINPEPTPKNSNALAATPLMSRTIVNGVASEWRVEESPF